MYTKRGTYTTLDEYAYFKAHRRITELNNYAPSYAIYNLDNAAGLIMSTIRSQLPIVVYADFDVDGQTSAGQFVLLLSYLRANFWVYAPMRSKDGYGISKAFVDRLAGQRGLLITVDNGIAAHEEIMLARQYGWQVLVMDHHQAGVDDSGNIIFPNADLIIDPCAIPAGCDFHDYCGAGLVYKLATLLVNDKQLLDHMLTIAAIGTVADVVPMLEDNRQIVQYGLELINHGQTTVGINKMVERLHKNGHMTSQDIAFGIAPMLNAASRLETEEPEGFSGSDFAIQTLLCSDEAQAAQMSMKLWEMNTRRKEITKDTLENLSIKDVDNVAFIKVDAPHGILGILAAKVAEKTGRPAFCFGEHNGVCSGSARSGDTTADVKVMLDSVQDLLLKGGGHAGAAGFSFESKNLEAIKDKLNQFPGIEPVKSDVYDLDLDQTQILPTLLQMDEMEPFGKDFERPVFKINCNFTQLEFWHAMGKDGNTLKLDLDEGISGVAFGAKEEFMKHKTPRTLSLIGTPKWNLYMGRKSPQFEIQAIEY